MSLIDDFKNKFPEFTASEIDTAFPIIEEELQCYFNYEYADNKCINQAILYLAAHLYVTSGGNGGAGDSGSTPRRMTASKTVGSVNVSYEPSGYTDSFQMFLGSTLYGQKFLMLTKRLAQGAFFV